MDSRESFQESFDHLMDLIKMRKLEKGVLYQFATSSNRMTGDQLSASICQALSSASKGAGYIYGCWNESTGLLGVTPELLFFFSGKENPKIVDTMALAGTARSGVSEEQFIRNSKELHEHGLVVQGISEALKKLGKVSHGEIELMRLPTLTHLLTPIKVELKGDFNFEEIVEVLHPTPALGAFPKQEGRGWLLAYDEKCKRGNYGIPIGLRVPFLGISVCYAGIRNVQWDESGMRIGAGCGVVERVFVRTN